MWDFRLLILVLGGGVVACGGEATPAAEAPAPGPVQPETDPEWRPTVSALTIVVSPPRSDWPCGIDVLAGKVEQRQVTIEYLPAFERRDTIVWEGERVQRIERTGRREDFVQVETPRYDCE